MLTWNDPSPPADTPTGYRAIAGLKPGGTVAQFGVSGNVFRLNGAPAGSYFFRVAGVNACGVSPESNEVYVTVDGPAVPAVVTGVHQFTGAPADGSNFPTLIQARDGNFYGTAQFGGGAANAGTVFRMTPAGVFTVLHAFTGIQTVHGAPLPTTATDGLQPVASLVEATDGKLYGVAGGGGASGGGIAFMVTKDGAFTQLYAFAGSTDGGSPTATLIQATDGNLYGAAQYGGTYNRGVIFKMTLPQ